MPFAWNRAVCRRTQSNLHGNSNQRLKILDPNDLTTKPSTIALVHRCNRYCSDIHFFETHILKQRNISIMSPHPIIHFTGDKTIFLLWYLNVRLVSLASITDLYYMAVEQLLKFLTGESNAITYALLPLKATMTWTCSIPFFHLY